MKRLIASALVTLAAVAAVSAPALAEPQQARQQKTQLVALGGANVERMFLRYDFDGVWVIDTQNILYRDETRDYYLVTLKAACATLAIRSRSFAFFPAWSWQLRANYSYEVRPEAGSRCDVARIEQLDDVRAKALRKASLRRVW